MEKSGNASSVFRAVVWGLAASMCLALAIVLTTWAFTDRSYAERAATELILPVGALWLFFCMIATSSWVLGRRGLAIGFALVWLLHGLVFNARIAGTWLAALEYPSDADPVAQLDSPLDAVVVLGGYAGVNQYGVPELSGDGQRLMLAAQLWHSGKARAVICTGESPLEHQAPRLIGRQLLVSIGVPDEFIFDVGGLNTKGEMAALDAFFSDPPEGWRQQRENAGRQVSEARIGLVTSAFHMPRAMRLAAERNLDFIPLPCAFRGNAGDWTPREFVPNVGAGKSFAIALKESLGRVVGR